MSDRQEAEQHVFDTAAAVGFDMRAFSIVVELSRLLDHMKDEGTAIDSGTGQREADLWVTIGGIEYFITVRPSNNQLIKEGVSREELGLPPLNPPEHPT